MCLNHSVILKSFIDHITEYIAEADSDNIKKGKTLYKKNLNDYWVPSTDGECLMLTVPSASGNSDYEVSIEVADGYTEIFCPCPAYVNHGDCKHCLAAAFWCFDNENELPVLKSEGAKSSKPLFKEKANEQLKEMSYTDVEIRGALETWTLEHLSVKRNFDAFNAKIKLASEKGPSLRFRYNKTAKEAFDVSIDYDLKKSYRTGCSCGANKKSGRFCEHIHAAFQYVYYQLKPDFFLTFRDFTVEKNEILKQFNLTLTDPEAQNFKWGLNYRSDLVLAEKPSFIVPKGDTSFFQQFREVVRSGASPVTVHIRPTLPTSVQVDFEVGLLFNFVSKRHIGFELEPLEVREKNNNPIYKKLNANEEANWALLKPLDSDLYELVTSLSDKGLLAWMTAKGRTYFPGYYNPWQRIMREDVVLLRKRYYEQLRKYWETLAKWKPVLLLLDGKFSNKTLKAVKVSEKFVNITFVVDMDDRFINIFLIPVVEDEDWSGKSKTLLRLLIYLVDNTLYLPAHAEDLSVIEMFKSGLLKFSKDDILEVFKTVISPLLERYPVKLPENFNLQRINTEPLPQLHLGELNEQSLMLYPKFLYDNDLLEPAVHGMEISEDAEGLKIITRKPDQEKHFFEFIRQLHPKFVQQRNNPYFYLPFSEVMKDSWFLKAIQMVQDAGYPVHGLQALKRFRYNTNKPTWEMKAGSGTDWFDLSIEISWGNISVPLKDIRKAIANRQNTVLLDDGTLGLLPEEWIKQYGLLLKMGEERQGTIRISKRHFGILDELAGQLNNKDVLAEIKSKKEKLARLDDLKTAKLSKKVSATLRPYQQSGFKWLQTLEELGWGGCLADDMGLGKTLQTIAFIQFLKEKYPGSTHLVVCPTSLLYNWQGEFDKFCPTLKYHIYYGQLRELGDEHFESYDVVLTSYGLARNDIEMLAKFSWHYVILDESQAIKNPDAVTTKAVGLLPCKNRLVLSGTPVQNNTYDLYAQFNFINPGLLGNRDFFRNEFANPIDKQADKEKAHQLRKMIYPFLLRRTKEQVAPDLPDKTETILWCNMGREQRSVYESYRKYYRDLILKKIDEVGMNKSGMYVLEGLLRLRQICDHPKLLKDENAAVEESVKTEELLREVEENTGQHKILIFSQFVEMLQVIKSELVKKKISFSYLDGSIAAIDRKKEVERFQNDEAVKVFLISLKAGGVGLNLTAADYVYIVDPWWNPAAERQAIDRTHRIGQTRKIFAYKMICKDSVEEKILKLQERKKALADELVSEDAGFVKKLTRDDIDFLLS